MSAMSKAASHETIESPPSEATQHGIENGQMATDKYGQALRFDPAAEAKLRIKIDLYVVPIVSLFYLFCFIDRANIGNARIAGLEKDLGLKGYEYNSIISIFFISYILFEIPSVLLCKWIGPGWFIPLATMLFGVVSLCNAFVHNFSEAAGVRFLLGIFEAGLMPGIAYYMSRWYRRSELAFRLSMYVVMAPLAGAFGGLLASAILSMDRFGSLHGWRMIFGIEGIVTISLGVAGFFLMTDRPETARWLTEEEKELAVARVQSERLTTSTVLDSMDKTKLLRGIFNPVTLSTAFIFMLNNITVQGMAVFAPTIVATLFKGKTPVQLQLLTVPPYVVGAFFTLLMPFLSWRFDRRLLFIILSTPLVMTGFAMFLGSTNLHVRYAATFLILSSASALGALTTAHVSANVVSDTARSAAIPTNIMVGSIGGLASSWAFLPFDAPNYHIGNGLNLAAAATTLIVAVLMLLWLKHDNKKRAARDSDEVLRG
ncbi:putative transporter [Cladobotryum mycophilum]|uniref:Transporter n=1 Tax=Cladobotryum mycophilum TaxID=491253 RepID=A0ABR0ST64_9HYPO